MGRVALDWARARWATERPTASIAGYQMERLSRVVRVRTRLSHAPSPMMNDEKLSSESCPLKVTI